jgi:hypothetical protein
MEKIQGEVRQMKSMFGSQFAGGSNRFRPIEGGIYRQATRKCPRKPSFLETLKKFHAIKCGVVRVSYGA